ncbi:colicin V production protein [Proteus mirabilis]|uniref:Colicin V production protein n=1 Tax=Proteus mirabilis TaxID=584 RepID=A0A2X2BNT0_PROMI|nr:colicin V production protein [Proteus mirabilis]
MVWIDYAIIAIIGFSALVSLIRGFVREALSLITWGCGFFCCKSVLSLSSRLFYSV